MLCHRSQGLLSSRENRSSSLHTEPLDVLQVLAPVDISPDLPGGIEESFLFQVLGSPRYMYGWSPSLLRSAGRVLRTWCLSAGHRVAHPHRSSISSSASERSCSSAHFASRITGVRAKDVATRGMGARFHEPLPPRISGSGGPSFGLSTLPPDVLACAAPHVHEWRPQWPGRRPGVAWKGPEWPGRLGVCAVIGPA